MNEKGDYGSAKKNKANRKSDTQASIYAEEILKFGKHAIF